MGGSDFSDLFRQLPIGFFLIPLVAGGVYIAMMAVIFRRARARRHRAREALGLNQTPEQPKPRPPIQKLIEKLPEPDLDQLLPEPDLDLLAMPAARPTPEIIEAEVIEPPPNISRAVSLPTTRQETEIDMAPDSNPLSDAVEVMRVYRDLNDGSLIIQMGNQRYRAADEIASGDLQRRFAAVVRDLATMAGESSGSGAGAPVIQPRTGGTTPILSEPARMAPAGVESDRLVRFKKMGTPPPTPTGRKGKEPETQLGIGEAVEEYLQSRLLASPEFATRSIHIRMAHDHSVRIEVDGHYYDAVADVVDADVREFLVSVMKEWEARH